jgi:hypothetical protein
MIDALAKLDSRVAPGSSRAWGARTRAGAIRKAVNAKAARVTWRYPNLDAGAGHLFADAAGEWLRHLLIRRHAGLDTTL